MKLNSVLAFAIALLLLGVGTAFGMWLEKPTIDDLVDRNRQLSAMDTLKTVQLDSARVAYSVLVDDFANYKDVHDFIEDSLSAVSNALKDKVREQGNEIASLVQANARLEEELEAAVGGIAVTDTSVSAELYFYKGYQDGSISADGYVTVFTPEDDEPYGNASLYFDLRMQPSVIMSRDDSGLATCDLSFGDMPIYLTDLVCVDNLGYDVPTRQGINWPTVGLTAALIGSAVIILSAFL